MRQRPVKHHAGFLQNIIYGIHPGHFQTFTVTKNQIRIIIASISIMTYFCLHLTFFRIIYVLNLMLPFKSKGNLHPPLDIFLPFQHPCFSVLIKESIINLTTQNSL